MVKNVLGMVKFCDKITITKILISISSRHLVPKINYYEKVPWMNEQTNSKKWFFPKFRFKFLRQFFSPVIITFI